MTTDALIYALAVLAATALLGGLYIRIWRSRVDPARTPTGFGALLAFVVSGAAAVADAPAGIQVALAFISLGTIAYWFDDVVELSARIRLAISLLVGASIGAGFYLAAGGEGLGTALSFSIAGALCCVVLTNVVNFYDGADLNLALYIALTSCLILAFSPTVPAWTWVALACLAFALAFAMFNVRPHTLYLGDAGSFAFAGVLTALGTAYLLQPARIPPEAALASALPAFDVFCVLVIRIVERHDLLTRNWLHLYQRLQVRHGGFVHLGPQIANLVLCLAMALLLQRIGVDRLLSTVIAAAVVTIPFYFAVRAAWAPRVPAPSHSANA